MGLSAKQIEFCKEGNHRWNFKGGATRSGKTYLDFTYIIPMRIRERAGKDGLSVLMGVTKSTIERNVLDPMRNIYGDTLVGTINNENKVMLFGEQCYALGAEKVSQVSKIRGASIKYCYGDEVADWSTEVFELLKSRLDKEYSCFDGTFNPQYPGHWLKEFLESDADIFSQTYTIDDNPFLPQKFVEDLKNEYRGTVYYDRYILGEWAAAEGLVYPMFNKNEHCFDELAWQAYQRGKWYISVDYGTVNPTAAGLWCIHGGCAYMVAEYYYDSRSTNHRRTDEEHYTALEKLADGHKIERVIVDPTAASFKETIRRHGKFAVWDADNSVLDGIRLTATLLAAGKIKVHSSCNGFLSEVESYRWDTEAAEDAVIKDFDHSMDQCRYFCKTVMEREVRATGILYGNNRN